MIEPGPVLVKFLIVNGKTEALRGTEPGDAPLHHRGARLFDSRGVSGRPEIRVRRAHRTVSIGDVTTELGHIFHLTVRLRQNLRGGSEPDGKADHVAIDFLLLARGAETVVEFLYDRSGDDLVPKRLLDGATQIGRASCRERV